MSTTFFDTAKRNFKDVPTENGIDTTTFLESAESVVALFDLLGNAAFKPVQSDMTGNIKKIRDRQLEAPLKSQTLQDLVANEKAEKKKTATDGLLWLNRGLGFTALALRTNISSPTEELSTSFTTAYDNTLKKHHGFMVRPIFGLAMKACPYRATFYEKLGSDPAKVKLQLEEWLAALENINAVLTKELE
ncbi:glycolipid transfer protein domain-containing protein [Peziza echinospora]|nr:glycolipid transfer protein domain-containing protein [Peziza echinospora]